MPLVASIRIGLALLLLVVSRPAMPQEPKISPSPLPTVGTIAPDFTLPDANTGKKRSPREFSQAKRPVALFFFCGCRACQTVAQEWAKYQSGNALPGNAATMIVYSTTDRDEAKSRIAASGLDPKRTAVLCDTEALTVTERLYHAEPCPRIFVIDRLGKIAHASVKVDATEPEPSESVAAFLAASALDALRGSAP
ncbi:MAG: redoxin domain-containing protein [Akkermansiaceae bacterium]|nr:redoxin domain-containing protein [Armatimonadota bacterium]